MYGWRGRLGIILGSSISVVEPDYNKMAPEGVTTHFNRVPFFGGRKGLPPGKPVKPSDVIEELRGMGELAADAAELLAHIHPAAMALA